MGLDGVWKILLESVDRPSFRRVDDMHPWDLYGVIDQTNERGLMLVADEEPPAPPEYETLDVVSSRRADGRWVLVIRLVRPGLESIFAHLCDDLVEASRGRTGGAGQAQFLLSRMGRWRRLLDPLRSGLSEQELRGLTGELVYLERVAIPEWGAKVAVAGWVGPLDAPQDFDLPGRRVEIKAVRAGAARVTISSLQQLDSGGAPLELCLVCLEPGQDGGPGSFKVGDLVRSVESLAEADPSAAADLAKRLAAAGLDPNSDCNSAVFAFRGIRVFDVGEGFPRIIAGSVAGGVATVRYEIDIASCAKYEKPATGGSDGGRGSRPVPGELPG